LVEIRLTALKAISELLILSGLVILGLVSGTFIALASAAPFFPDVALADLPELIGKMPEGQSLKWLALYMQGLAAFTGFLAVPFFFSRYLTVTASPVVFGKSPNPLLPWLLSLSAMVFFVPFVSFLEEWNREVVFPSGLKELEIWFKAKEDEISVLTKWLTTFESPVDFVLAFLVIGVMAGVAEEYLFRGIVQPRFIALFGNAHVGIWVTGFVFGAIHFQFYGMFPRMMLGVVLGYLAHFSGKLQYSVVGHTLNNGLVVVLLYLNSLQITHFDLDSGIGISWYLAVVSAIVTFWQLTSFRNYYKKSRAIY